MKKNFKKILNLILVLVVGFIGGILGVVTMQKTGISSTISTNTTTTTTSNDTLTSNTTYNNTTSVSEAVDKVQNAVVSVLNYQTTSSMSSDNPYSIFGNNNSNSSGGELALTGEGSGVIYKKDGDFAYLVTNTHVVTGAEQIEIKLADGNTVEGVLVGSDTYSDISVIKIDASSVTAIAEFGDSDSVNVGEIAIAIGSPLGAAYANSVTQGIVSSLSRTVTSKSEDGQTISTNAIQTDAAINPGNSGGPLINIQGQVIGITSSKITSSSSSVSVEGMGFAIPANDAVAIITQLEKNGKVERPALGIQMSSLSRLSATDLSRLNVPKDLTAGIVVVTVQSGLSADGILESYDIITKIDDKIIESSSDLQSALYSKNIGDTITVTFYRDGKERTADIQLKSSTEDLQ